MLQQSKFLLKTVILKIWFPITEYCFQDIQKLLKIAIFEVRKQDNPWEFLLKIFL